MAKTDYRWTLACPLNFKGRETGMICNHYNIYDYHFSPNILVILIYDTQIIKYTVHSFTSGIAVLRKYVCLNIYYESNNICVIICVVMSQYV